MPIFAGFTDGYQSIIGERGVKLSGGQRQRLALARALLCDRPLLIIDDALSAIDVETEQQVLQGILSTLKEKSVLLISHRVNVLRHADRIVLLDQGRIVDEGRHEDPAGQPLLPCYGGEAAEPCIISAIRKRGRSAPSATPGSGGGYSAIAGATALGLAGAVLLSLIVTVAALGLPRLMQLGIDHYIVTDALSGPARIAGLGRVTVQYGLLVGVIFLVTFCQVVMLEWIGQSVMHRLRQHLFAHLLTLDLALFSQSAGRPSGHPLDQRYSEHARDVHLGDGHPV